MSRCRCNEIASIGRDIDTLNTAQTRLRSMIDRDTIKNSELGTLAEDVAATFQPASVSRMATEIRNMNREVATANTGLRNAVVSEITRLNIRRSSLVAQDRAFHRNS